MTLDASALTPELRDLLGSVPEAAVTATDVQHDSAGTALGGYLATPADADDLSPAVLVLHDWFGLTDHVKVRAEMLARLGYIALAGDIYGADSQPADGDEAGALAGRFYGDVDLFRERVLANLDTLKATPGVDQSRIAVMGYCFGGSGALEAARAGADVAGVVSFHGNLSTQSPAASGSVTAPVLVLTGAADPIVPPAAVEAFEDEMTSAGADDWQIVSYSGALHAFAVPGTDAPDHGAAFQERANTRSWAAMETFFGEVLA
ncbi:dienelactone hydrolase [Frondihabitans sp. PhB188]|uniref:dienelactone hydrolase family protein n=1 Tax=Frondihabitans sp. PhB188 TaxID=2485200 RepID=UPI000F46378D|nr:dienelactone hydrolase family protein [Frondihabitans sp. PhB188]ROQ39446.1 dienelactone hydrolase [Frondihabitans sp. PhB188]